MRGRLAILLPVLVALCGCAAQEGGLRADRDAVLRERVQSAYAVPLRTGEVARWSEAFAPDALALHDGIPALHGREEIRRFGATVHANFEIRQFDLTVDEVRTDGRWAITAGRYVALFVPRSAQAYAGAAGPRQGKFALVWERRDGDWRIVLDMGNSTDAPP